MHKMPRPFPLEPLLEVLGRPPIAAVARQCKVHRRQVYRWRDEGLSLSQADHAAIAAGLHPTSVWPDF